MPAGAGTPACIAAAGTIRRGGRARTNAARWGRIAVYVAMIAPVLYAITRYAWALGIPLGMSEEHLRSGQESGMWISGLFLATFGLVGALLMLGLVQRWGEVFPRWMIGLAGRRVPIGLAVVPASIVAVLLMVGGITIWSVYAQMADAAAASGECEGSSLALPRCSWSGARRSPWRRWATITGGAARAMCVVAAWPARSGSHPPDNQMERIVIIGNGD